MSVKNAFDEICQNAKNSGRFYVCLYCNRPYYGGPEDGGWWSSDDILIKYQEFCTEEAANAAYEKINQLAEELSQQARKEWSEYCRASMEWLDERGLDADFLPEVDGEEQYYVTVTNEIPTHHFGCTHYE